MTTRTPPPTRPPKGASDSRWWQGFLTSIYQMWQRLNRDQFTIGEVTIYTGTGTPEGNQTGNVADTFHRTDGGAGTSFYVKESGTGNTGWAAK